MRRAFIVAPADPGNLGDEAMMMGALHLLQGHQAIIVNDSPNTLWHERLIALDCAEQGLEERQGPLAKAQFRFSREDVILIIGADLIDGTCGLEPSLSRLEFARRAARQGARVIITCSFRAGVAPQILRQLRRLRGVEFWLREGVSVENFSAQLGMTARRVPDLSFYCPAPAAASARESAADPLIALNLSEQSFRSFYDEHNDLNRKAYAEAIISQVADAMPRARYLLLSNDSRAWPNHPSDDVYAGLLQEALRARLGAGIVIEKPSRHSYGENIRALGQASLLVTGRMHLAFAAIRAGCLPLILMGRGRGYSSHDKMRGGLLETLGDATGVIQSPDHLGPAVVKAASQFAISRQRLVRAGEARNSRLADFKAELEAEEPRHVPPSPPQGLSARLLGLFTNGR